MLHLQIINHPHCLENAHVPERMKKSPLMKTLIINLLNQPTTITMFISSVTEHDQTNINNVFKVIL